MSLARLVSCGVLLLPALASVAAAAHEPSRVLRVMPASAPFVLHVRNVPELLANWKHTPMAQTWAEPQVQAFFAPAAGMLSAAGGEKAFAEFETATGMTPLEFAGLFPGEVALVVLAVPTGEDTPDPAVVFCADLGGNRTVLESLVKKLRERKADDGTETILEEEFQGETLFVLLEQSKDGGTPREAGAWAIVDDVFWFGMPKATVQQVIASWKEGGATEPLTTDSTFAKIYERDPGAQASFYLNLELIMNLATQQMEAEAAAKKERIAAGAAEEGDAKPSPFEMVGLSPTQFVHALGLDALRGLHVALTLDPRATTVTTGVTWSEQRGLLKLLAYGDAPAPQPRFVPPAWTSVTAARFTTAQLFTAIKDTAREANPMLEFLLMQNVAGLNEKLGIDIERDFFGSLGDEIVRAYSFNVPPGPAGLGSEQLWAVSLANSEAFKNSLNALWNLAPMVANGFTHREYLGHEIHTYVIPLGPTGLGFPITYAVTPSHLLLDLGGASMLETAIQRMDGDGETFWTQPEVVKAMHELPPGGSSFTYQDVRGIITKLFPTLATLAGSPAGAGIDDEAPDVELDEDGRPIRSHPRKRAATPPLGRMVDASAIPDPEVIAKHWSTSTGAIYRDTDGLRILFRINHVE